MKPVLILCAALLIASPASAQSLLVRSDLPLWAPTAEQRGVSPHAIASADEIGCVSSLKFGDWRYGDADADPDEAQRWLRISNYGVFHCAAVFRETYERTALPHVLWEYGYLVELGAIRGPEGSVDLFALQIGMRGGSRYVLLASPVDREGMVSRYRLLEPDCPRGAERNAGQVSIWRTDYCVVADKPALIAMARRAAQKPSTGYLEWVGEPDPADPD